MKDAKGKRPGLLSSFIRHLQPHPKLHSKPHLKAGDPMAKSTHRLARGREEARRGGVDRKGGAGREGKGRDEEGHEDRARDQDERDDQGHDRDEDEREEFDDAGPEASDDADDADDEQDEEEASPEPARAQRGRDAGGGRNGKGTDPGNGRAASRSRLSGAQAVRVAKEYLVELTGREPEAVSGLERKADGWSITLEVVEMERVPQTTDVMGSFRVQLDGEGELAGCTRVRRYYRNQALEE